MLPLCQLWLHAQLSNDGDRRQQGGLPWLLLLPTRCLRWTLCLHSWWQERRCFKSLHQRHLLLQLRAAIVPSQELPKVVHPDVSGVDVIQAHIPA